MYKGHFTAVRVFFLMQEPEADSPQLLFLCLSLYPNQSREEEERSGKTGGREEK